MQCPRCGYVMTDFDRDCPRCSRQGLSTPPLTLDAAAPPAYAPPSPARVNPWNIIVGMAVALLVSAGGALGFVHVVESSEGSRIIGKVHFTYAETFVSMDAITGMPFVKAKERWPLAVKALQREGILESDADFQERIQRQAEEDLRERMSEYTPPY